MEVAKWGIGILALGFLIPVFAQLLDLVGWGVPVEFSQWLTLILVLMGFALIVFGALWRITNPRG